MKCLVTGGAGFIGSNIVSLLLQRGHEVTIFDDFSTGYKENIQKFTKIKLIQSDIRDRASVENAMVNQDIVFHLAASVGNKKSLEDPFFDASSNVMGVLNILEAMKKHKVENIIFSSSAGIFGEPQYQPVDETHPCEPDSPYGCTKLAGEKLILSYMKLYGIRAVCLRYFNVYGINQRFDAYGNVIPIFVTRAIRGENLTIYGDGEQTRDFVNVRDVAAVNVAAAENASSSGVFNIGSGIPITINNLARMICDIANTQVDILHCDPRPGDVRFCTADINKMKNTFNLSPSTNFLGNLQEYYSWMKNLLMQGHTN